MNNKKLVSLVKAQNEDFEFYPTTQAMIDHIEHNPTQELMSD